MDILLIEKTQSQGHHRMKVQNKIIVVTGGGNGIGRELVLRLLAKGAHVAAVDINEAGLKETAELAGKKKDNLSLHVANVTDRAAVEALPGQVIAKHGAVDGLFNVAGIIQPFVRIKDLEYAAIERVMNVNFYGTLYMTKTFLPHLLKRPVAHIANISSMGGFLPVPGQGIYGASKAAVKLMTEALHSELANTNVRVTVIFPGAIGTNIANNSGVGNTLTMPDDSQRQAIKPLAPSKAAEIIVKGVERDEYEILVGRDSAFMNFIYRVSSRRAARFISKQMASLLPD
ncbi:MAG: SDR family oxidoreductase [Caldilineales bacterium]|nr:SDR family oxidoreductase [Caldilineales bacterium]